MDQQTPKREQGTSMPAGEARYGRRLSRTSQLMPLLVIAVVLFVAFAAPMALRVIAPREPAETTTASVAASGAAFKVTSRQWATLKVGPVEERVFQDIIPADGKIAVDDDLVTPVFSPFSGRITRLMARAGDAVAAGTPLFAIQATELAQAQNDLISTAAALRTAKAQLALAATNEKRQHDLYLAQGAALKDWQQSQLDLATARGGVESASIAFAAVRNRLRIFGKSDAEIAQIESTPDIMSLAAETVVNAPIGGIVVQRQLGLGQNIVSASSGASAPVFLIGDPSKVWLVANLREEDAPAVRKGELAEISVLAFPNRVFRASLSYVAAAIDPVTHRLSVRAELGNPDGLLKPEMFASFRIITGDDVRSLAVPDVALVHEADSAHVWLADPSAKTLELRVVTYGRSREGMVEIRDGLKPGDRIVTSGAVFIDRAATGD